MWSGVAARGILAALGLTSALVWSDQASAKPKKDNDDPVFAARLAALKRDPSKIIVVNLKDDRPVVQAAPASGTASSAPVLVASARTGIYIPDLLTPEDIRAVVTDHLPDVRRCFKKQLDADPTWTGEVILDLAIRRTGRVSEVAVEPGRERTGVVGSCLMSVVPKWTFPEFTGEGEGGVVREVVNASFPLQLQR